jgi:uncharacterized protein YukE
MTFHVEPQALRQYAEDLAAVRKAADTAKQYVNTHGLFSGHEKGLIGTVMPGHDNFVEALNQMLRHLADLLDSSDAAVKQLATSYEQTDTDAAATVDASYPAVQRPRLSRD